MRGARRAFLIMYISIAHALTMNYGGILQAYALQKSLQYLNIKCLALDYIARDCYIKLQHQSYKFKLRQLYKFILLLFGLKKSEYPLNIALNRHVSFKRRFMNTFRLDNARTQLKRLAKKPQFIVGSDQVWRCVYARNIESVPFFFLNFATPDQRKRSIAYAASFGSDEWEGTPEETVECAQLLKQFKAVSVREHSGVDICREVFGVETVQMPDPTLLLEQEDYNYLIRNWRTKSTDSPFMAVYLLDQTNKTTALTEEVSRISGLYSQSLLYKPGARRLMDRLPLSIPQWLRFIRDSKCVLTDSFHGCVFSIIFNKPFVCLGNEKRGSARFDSLLGTFGLQNRLVTRLDPDIIIQILKTPIDWERVNAIRHSEQERAFDFLRKNLD